MTTIPHHIFKDFFKKNRFNLILLLLLGRYIQQDWHTRKNNTFKSYEKLKVIRKFK